MIGDFPDDTFTENDVLACLESQGLKYKNGSRYILSQCPTHEDKNPSVQIYKDDWFVNCHSGCGRYHITKAFPELREENKKSGDSTGGHEASNRRRVSRSQRVVSERVYTEYDLYQDWLKMPMIPREHGDFKGMPLEHLDYLGWRWDAAQNAYFIPYFNRPKDKIPFAQYRYLSGDVRFRFLKDAKPTMYGTWNLDPGTPTIFLVEGTSDAAVLDYCGVPWIAAPSAASGELVKLMAGWTSQNGITVVYAGDNDDAGDKLRAALAEVVPFRVCQPPKQYKDWGDFFVAEGVDAVIERTTPEIGTGNLYVETENDPQVQAVLDIFPGATVLPIDNDVAPKRKGATQDRGSH